MKSLQGKLGVIFIGLIILGYGFPVVNIAYAQSTLALQEKCAKSAKERFIAGLPGLLEVDPINWSYTSHYNKKLDKCFIFWEGSKEWKDEEKITTTKSVNLLLDVYEGKEYATRIVFHHYYPQATFFEESFTVLGKSCRKSEYEIAVRGYMEE